MVYSCKRRLKKDLMPAYAQCRQYTGTVVMGSTTVYKHRGYNVKCNSIKSTRQGCSAASTSTHSKRAAVQGRGGVGKRFVRLLRGFLRLLRGFLRLLRGFLCRSLGCPLHKNTKKTAAGVVLEVWSKT
jgi:hypothetical protein